MKALDSGSPGIAPARPGPRGGVTPPAGGPGSDPVRPSLKWAGGKRWQIPHLLEYWRPHSYRRLVEPFCGGLAVTLGLVPARALLNDANPHVVNFYNWVKRGLHIRIEMENDERLYYRHRSRFNRLLASGQGDSLTAASLFYFMNRTGYNGLCRFNRSGQFNVPFGRYQRIGYVRRFPGLQKAFEAWEFTSHDCEQVPIQKDDFIYADPPYDVPFTQYAKGGFGWDDQVRTALWLSKHKGPVVLSNQATDGIIHLYTTLGFKLILLNAPRRISCTGDRSPAREVLAIRNL